MKNIYLLDTNIISEVTRPQPSENLLSNLELHHGTCAISSITWFELLKGVELLEDGRKKEKLTSFIMDYVAPSFEIIPYDQHAASVNAQLVSKLIPLGKATPILDTQIASVAIANNMVLVTQNTKDFKIFSEVGNLMMEDWGKDDL
ncbi:MAG: type II toxin-antitoxin system VapC family toxin [Treponema sp.]|nr:type II toxin-antitoxin system VapC family toxin [Treponema sp.]